MAAKEVKQIERQLILYDIFRQNDEDTGLSTIMHHLPGMNMRTLQRDIRDLTDAGLLQVYFSRDKKAYINYDGKPAGENAEVSSKKKEHLERLKRLAKLMGYEVYEKADELYFGLFPEATERMRKRDFEILRHIGFYAGFAREENEYVIYRNEAYGIDNNYGIFKSKRTGKMMHYV